MLLFDRQRTQDGLTGEEIQPNERRRVTAPHVSRLQGIHQRLVELLPPVIDSVVDEMKRNNSLTDEQINRIGRQTTPEDTATMLLTVLQTQRRLAYDGFVQAVRALQYEDILAVLGINVNDRI